MKPVTVAILLILVALALTMTFFSYRHMASLHPPQQQSTSHAPRDVISLATGSLRPLLSENSLPTNGMQRLHVIILVHGWIGCPEDLGYVHHKLEDEASKIVREQNNKETFYVYTCVSNTGRTNDGIQAGAERITTEINDFLQNVREQNEGVQEITLSMVGYSLGGLYARYALPNIIPSPEENQLPKITPKVFCTIATPHLGSRGHMLFKFPAFVENWMSSASQTGRDLFHHTPHIQNTVTDPRWIDPLLRFEKRIAYANTYSMDLVVPTSTAAFVSPDSESEHYFQESVSPHSQRHRDKERNPFVALVVETRAQHDLLNHPQRLSELETTQRLDAMGWTKVFVDFVDGYQEAGKPSYTSSSLHSEFNRSKKNLFLPMGHDLVAVNSKNVLYSFVMKRGRPVVDQLAWDLVHDIVYGDAGSDATCKSA